MQRTLVECLTRQAAILSCAALLAGCGVASDAPQIAPVRGTVTVDGEPRGGLTVTFYPEVGGRPASGKTEDDGTFVLTTLNTGDGAPVGTSQVAVTGSGGGNFVVSEIEGPPMPGMPGYDAYMQAQRDQIDPKYGNAESSGLLYTVPAEGLPDLKIELQ